MTFIEPMHRNKPNITYFPLPSNIFFNKYVYCHIL